MEAAEICGFWDLGREKQRWDLGLERSVGLGFREKLTVVGIDVYGGGWKSGGSGRGGEGWRRRRQRRRRRGRDENVVEKRRREAAKYFPVECGEAEI